MKRRLITSLLSTVQPPIIFYLGGATIRKRRCAGDLLYISFSGWGSCLVLPRMGGNKP